MATFYPDYSLATTCRKFPNNIGKIFSHKIKATYPELRKALEQKLQAKGYTEQFLKLLNDHSIIALGRKEGMAVKDWRI